MAVVAPTRPVFDPYREFRFSVVIYGGVSLAISINGAVQEMLRMVRATAPSEPSGTEPLLTDPKGSEKVYRILGQILGDPSRNPVDIYANMSGGAVEPIRSRFVTDVLPVGLMQSSSERRWQTTNHSSTSSECGSKKA